MTTVLYREIKSYRVIVQRSSVNKIRRVIRLALKKAKDSNLTEAQVSFETGAAGFGTLDNLSPALILPVEDYEDFYHMLQTESPVYLAAASDAKSKVIYVGLSSDPEGPGEGFSDSDAVPLEKAAAPAKKAAAKKG